jgi:hypothetical protein
VTDLSNEERMLIERLETYLLWAGRYPVPLKADTYARDTREHREMLSGSDWNTAQRLFNKLRSLITPK